MRPFTKKRPKWKEHSSDIDNNQIVDCGLWYLAEYENYEFVLNKNPKEFSLF